jgi:hypothetical protein
MRSLRLGLMLLGLYLSIIYVAAKVAAALQLHPRQSAGGSR